MDANMDITGGAQGNSLAEDIYKKFHAAIKDAKTRVKTGLLVDFHRHVSKTTIR